MEIERKIIDFIKLNNKDLVSKISENKKIDAAVLEELKKAISEFKKTLIYGIYNG
jgi:F0F1-type ATP synthase alpha subunit